MTAWSFDPQLLIAGILGAGLIIRKFRKMSAVLDRLVAVVPQLEASVAKLKSDLATAQSAAGTPDAVLEPLVARLETLELQTIPAPPPAV